VYPIKILPEFPKNVRSVVVFSSINPLLALLFHDASSFLEDVLFDHIFRKVAGNSAEDEHFEEVKSPRDFSAESIFPLSRYRPSPLP
jgi:hypothetical protein